MKEFVIITDSTSDLCKELREKYNIDYVHMNISYLEKEYKSSLDWDEYSAKDLYDVMRNGGRIKTTQVPYNVYFETFEKYLNQGKDILYISCSSALSGSINIARIVRDELLEKYPNAKIRCVDSLISCLGQGALVLEAAKMRDNGCSLNEIVTWVEVNRLKMNQVATVESLEYLRRAGRVKASKAIIGNLFGVKPIIISDIIGQNYAFKKIKGRRASLLYLVEYVKENIVNSKEQVIYIGHADSIEDAIFVKEHIIREIECKDVYIDFIGATVGSTVGPGTIGVYFFGKEVTILGD